MTRPDGEPARPSTVAPGFYEIAGSQAVVWWDPHVLPLSAEASLGLRRDDLIVKDGDPAAVAARMRAYEEWASDRAAVRQAAQVPSITVQTATSWAAEAAGLGIDQVIADAADIEIVELPGVAERPRGARFGTLVHAVLATVPLDAEDGSVRRAAEVQARMAGAPPAETAAAAIVVSSVLRHDLMRRARVAASVRRETPVTWLQNDGVLVEGVLDLAFDEGDSTIVVDFKTDHELAAGEARYRAQLQQYVQAVARVTGRAGKGVLFRI